MCGVPPYWAPFRKYVWCPPPPIGTLLRKYVRTLFTIHIFLTHHILHLEFFGCQILLDTVFLLTQIILIPHNLLDSKHTFPNKLYLSKVFESEILEFHTCFKANSYPKFLTRFVNQMFCEKFLLDEIFCPSVFCNHDFNLYGGSLKFVFLQC